MLSNTKKLAITLGIAVLVFASYWYLQRPQTVTNQDIPMFSAEEEASDSFVNVTQGSTWQKNITLILSLDEKVAIPFENLTILSYNKTSILPDSQEKILNYTFSDNPLILSPHEYNTTVLTVTMAEDAPVGRYVLIANLGNSNITNISAYSLVVRVNPK
ncbi:MAG: hypothetical protein ACQCN6_07215 [Candidatus Bathyarchaeia archaeon]|jgi:hypothetical protein